MIELTDLTARYGHVAVIRQFDLTITPGEIVALLGANGAGKSTLLHVIAGLHREISGSLSVKGTDLTGLDAAETARRGISLVPSGRQVFGDLTVLDNLTVGLHGTGIAGTDRSERIDQVVAMFPVLGEFARRRAGLLSGGQQQMLAIGRALVRKPDYLLLDEPSLGLAPQIVEQILSVLTPLASDGMGILLAEQNAAAALRVCDRGIIIENGEIVQTDTAAVLLNDADVGAHYLGSLDDDHVDSPAPVLPKLIFEPLTRHRGSTTA